MFGEIGAATRKGLKNMIAARQKRVQGQVYAQLLSLDDASLARAGFNRSEVAEKATNFIQL